ncbi:YdcF family protein [Hydrogenophaga sp.]|uniref:YdcF family protein n=1 Tax=Hydrogenophaga sp. TaxID=1904254 RepID=UPI0035AE877E
MMRGLLSMVGVILAGSGAWLLFVDGTFHFGVVLSLGLGVLLLLVALAWSPLRRWVDASAGRRWLWRTACGAATVWALSVLAFFALPVPHGQAAAAPTDTPKALIVLGAGSAVCAPSPVLQSRLDTAAEAARRWPSALVVLSGGRNHFHNVACTEAEVMQQALVAQGLDAARLVQEGQSANTTENFAYSAKLLGARGITPDQPLAVVTSEFHGARALRLAAHQGFTHLSFVAAPTPLRYRYHLWLREYFAAAWSWVSGEG